MTEIKNFYDIINYVDTFTEEQYLLRTMMYDYIQSDKTNEVLYTVFERQKGLTYALHHIANEFINDYRVYYVVPRGAMADYFKRSFNMNFTYLNPSSTKLRGIVSSIIIFDNVPKSKILEIQKNTNFIKFNYVVIGENIDRQLV